MGCRDWLRSRSAQLAGYLGWYWTMRSLEQYGRHIYHQLGYPPLQGSGRVSRSEEERISERHTWQLIKPNMETPYITFKKPSRRSPRCQMMGND